MDILLSPGDYTWVYINPFISNAPFLHPLKTADELIVSNHFVGLTLNPFVPNACFVYPLKSALENNT